MHTPTDQNPSPNPEASPARRRRREQIIVVAEGVFCAALALAGAFLLRGPNGPVDPAALHARMGAGPFCGRGVLLAALLLCLTAEFDLLGRFLAGPLARMVHGRTATGRQTADCRIAVQAFLLALVGIGPLIAPNVFPAPHGWGLAAILAALALPIGLSVVERARNRHARCLIFEQVVNN